MHLVNEVLQHLLRDRKVGDDTVLQRPYGSDVLGRATEHLLGFGHRDIAFVGDTDDDLGFNPGVDRFEGYRAALRYSGIPLRSELVKTGPHSREAAHDLTRQLFGTLAPPTAIVATSDTQAFGVMAAVRALGKQVPSDVSVVGFDDLDMAEHLGLTTVRQPLYESGVLGARMLLDRRAEAAGRLPTESFGQGGERILPRLMGRASVFAEKVPVPTLIVALALGALGVYAAAFAALPRERGA